MKKDIPLIQQRHWAVSGVSKDIHVFHVHPTGAEIQARGLFMNRRPLALGAAGGSLVSLAFRFVADNLDLPAPLQEPLCQCGELLDLVQTDSIEWRSFALGLLAGILLWPFLELLVLLRAWWRVFIQRQLAALSKRTKLYRIL